MATILILDDRNTNRKILAQLAMSVEPGVTVRACASGEEGLAAARTQAPDLVFLKDVDGDDRLSLQEEVNALLKDFEAADVNNDGALTYGELEAYVTRSRR